MRPQFLHRICARPMMISWIIGTLIIWIIVTCVFIQDGVIKAALTDFTSLTCLLIAYACFSGLGFFAGVFTVFWPVVRFCRYINGAPFAIGDYATILTGPRTGTIARVYKLTVGQGGDLLPRLDLGTEVAAKHGDIFDDYALLRLPSESTNKPTENAAEPAA